MLNTTCFNFLTREEQPFLLTDSVFKAPLKSVVVHHVVVGHQVQQRGYNRQVKDRSQVRGGGRKPWKQKGQGRARHGSIRSPIWRGGGVVFGPQSVQHGHFKVNRRCYRAALKMILSAKFDCQQLFIVNNLTCPTGKTKLLRQTLATHRAALLTEKTLLISDRWSLSLRAAAHNLTNLTTIGAQTVNPYQLLRHQLVVLTPAAVTILVNRAAT